MRVFHGMFPGRLRGDHPAFQRTCAARGVPALGQPCHALRSRENPLEKKTVDIPVGEYIFEGEDDIFLYFRSPTEMEYRVYHKEGYAEGAFQLGGIALARKEQWDQVEYPACTYIDGEDQHQKRLTCPLESSYLMQRRGTDWESDFDKE